MLQDDLNAKYNYDPHSGILSHAKGFQQGKAVGTINNNDLLICSALGRMFNVHVAIWIMHYGDICTTAPYGVTHIDKDRLNNRLGNLRARTKNDRRLSCRTSKSKSNAPGITDIGHGFRVMAYINNRQRVIGIYETIQEAMDARMAVERHVGLDAHEGVLLPSFEELRRRREEHCRSKVPQYKRSDLPKGVSQLGKRYAARISVDGASRYLGCFDTTRAAHQVYKDAVNAKITLAPVM